MNLHLKSLLLSLALLPTVDACGTAPGADDQRTHGAATSEDDDFSAVTDDAAFSLNVGGYTYWGRMVGFTTADGQRGVVRGLVTNAGGAGTVDNFVGLTYDRATYGYRGNFDRQARANINNVCARLAVYGSICDARRTSRPYPWNGAN